MDVRACRTKNLQRLLIKRGSAIRLAERTGLPEAYISQMKLGNRPIGEKTARKIELAAGLGRYSLDQKDMQPPKAPGSINTEALATIIKGINVASDAAASPLDDTTKANLIARMYDVYEKTGKLPDPEHALLLADP